MELRIIYSSYNRESIAIAKSMPIQGIDFAKEKIDFPIAKIPCIVDLDSKIIITDFTSLDNAIEQIKAEIERKATPSEKKYTLIRRNEYELSGLTAKSWILAYIQKEIDGDSTEWDALAAQRATIKDKIKKPEIIK